MALSPIIYNFLWNTKTHHKTSINFYGTLRYYHKISTYYLQFYGTSSEVHEIYNVIDQKFIPIKYNIVTGPTNRRFLRNIWSQTIN